MLITRWVIYRLYAQTSLRGSPPINTTAYWVSPLGYPEGSSNSELVQIWTHRLPSQTAPSQYSLKGILRSLGVMFCVSFSSSTPPHSNPLSGLSLQTIMGTTVFHSPQAIKVIFKHWIKFLWLKCFDDFAFPLRKSLASFPLLTRSSRVSPPVSPSSCVLFLTRVFLLSGPCPCLRKCLHVLFPVPQMLPPTLYLV